VRLVASFQTAARADVIFQKNRPLQMTGDEAYRCVKQFIGGNRRADLPIARARHPELCLRNSGGRHPKSWL